MVALADLNNPLGNEKPIVNDNAVRMRLLEEWYMVDVDWGACRGEAAGKWGSI